MTTISTSISLNSELLEKIRDNAKKEGRSVSNYISRLIEQVMSIDS